MKKTIRILLTAAILLGCLTALTLTTAAEAEFSMEIPYGKPTVDGVIEVVNATVYGDVNGDETVDGKDVLILRKYMSNYNDDTQTSTVTVSEGADANGDGKIDGRDLLLLRKYMANYDDDLGSSTVVLGPAA